MALCQVNASTICQGKVSLPALHTIAAAGKTVGQDARLQSHHLSQVCIRMVGAHDDQIATEAELLAGVWEVPASLSPWALLDVFYFESPAQTPLFNHCLSIPRA